MTGRLSALPLLGMIVVGAPLTFAGIVFGYWLSDLVYEVGLWPVGMLMRIGLLMALLGAVMWFLFSLFTVIRTLIFGSDWLEKL